MWADSVGAKNAGHRSRDESYTADCALLRQLLAYVDKLRPSLDKLLAYVDKLRPYANGLRRHAVKAVRCGLELVAPGDRSGRQGEPARGRSD